MIGSILLTGGIVVNAQMAFRADVRIEESRIIDLGDDLGTRTNELVVDCTDQYVYPGLINAHDHLSFNLFPRLGDPPYANSYEWGTHIRSKYESVINPIVRIPLRDRLFWGAWKNLFSGVTRVVHHDPYFLSFRLWYPVEVLRRYTFAHSLGFDDDIRQALARRRVATPFIIHVAEGTDERAAGEIKNLHELGGIDDRTVAVHAVGIQESDIAVLEASRSSVVWCPASNDFLFRATMPVKALRGRVRIAIGTDSTLTGSASMFEELRVAHEATSLTPKELFGMVTDSPRKIFGLPPDAGVIAKGGQADLFLLRASEESPYATLLHSEPGDITLLFRRGKVLLHDDSFDDLFGHDRTSGPRVVLNQRSKWIASTRWPAKYRLYKPFLKRYSYLGPEHEPQVSIKGGHS